jgi:uncharacterized protein YceK
LIDVKFLPLALTMLGGCSTIISSHTNPSGHAASRWAAIDQLPIELHGNIPGLSASDLTARLRSAAPKLLFASNGALPIPSGGRRVVMYVNASSKLASNAMCDAGETLHPGNQTGPRATVSGALCDGKAVRSTVSRQRGHPIPVCRWLVSSFRIMREQDWSFRAPPRAFPARIPTALIAGRFSNEGSWYYWHLCAQPGSA